LVLPSLLTCSVVTAKVIMNRVIFSLMCVGMQNSAATELTASNWDKETSGKQVFVKFLAPW